MARSTASKVAHLAPDDERRAKRLKLEKQELYQPPSTGRATKMGKRVEKPAEPTAGGPSGQRVEVKHDRKHTNK